MGVQRRLDLRHGVERRTVLAPHVGAELDADPVVVVDHRAGIQRRGHAVLPDAVVQRERIVPAVGHDEAAVDHRSPQVPVREVHPQLEARVAVRLADRAVKGVVHGLDARVRRDDVERAPDRRELRLVGRVVEVVAAVPPALAERGIEHFCAGLARRSRARAAPRARPPPPRPRRPARCRRRDRSSPTTGANVSRVASSSYMRITDGRWPTCSARRIAAMPALDARERDRGEPPHGRQRRRSAASPA